MKRVEILDLTKKAIAQTMGATFMEQVGDLAALDSYKLADIGKTVTGDDNISSLNNNLISLIGKHVLDSKEFKDSIKNINVDSFEWGGFLERTRIGLGEIMDDPLYNKTVGLDYSAIEHTYYGQDVKSKIFAECKAIMTPMSTEKDQLKEAFNSLEALESYIAARRVQIENTIKIALHVYKKMLFSCAIAVSDAKNDSAVHLITEAVALGIINKINEGTPEAPSLRNPTYIEVRNNKEFLKYACERIAEIRDYMKEISTAFNDATIPTWSDTVNVELLADFEKALKFNLKADTFHKDELGFGEYEKITSWQGIVDSTNKEFDPEVLSTVSIAADNGQKLGIGKNAYTKKGVVALLFDPMAIGMCLYRNKVTSSYTACADFWNTFHHVLVNYLLDDSYGIVAVIMD